MKHARQDLDGATAGYRGVLSDGEAAPGIRALAHRGLGLALLAAVQEADGLTELRRGVDADPSTTALLTEAVTLSIRHGDPAMALGLVESAPKDGAGVGRLRFLKALALARTGKAAEAAAILREGVEIQDLREGEDAIAALWEEVCPDEPVPAAYQFGMH
jgi:hypothetical protein